SYRRDPSNLASLDTYIDVRHDEGSAANWRPELLHSLQQTESFATLYSLGKLAWLDRQYGEAANYFERALHLNSDQKLLYYNYAYALAQVNRRNEAIAAYLQAIRKDPTFWEAHYNLALLYTSGGDTQNAIARFEEVLRLNPGHSPTLVQIAQLFVRQN